ncbi:MAG: hypothetical protein J0I34_06950 [Pseudonocardia sp.]|uniref:DUF6286 domain-containing protein n=1 Tax=unclassified Pseudonocardia TaxID=2619320 RepID=UPI00086BE3E1|nr:MULTISPECIES: DUF6286 domain-containing protein [unclassified Pseudonocardia]MBN9108503.1 hypothetical protein [Pseudonocardia sp.]ODU27987.1 MAG: hypothetical protein ABS80_02920 [Pseudonocardia sp. SCN 72-51]ODV07846.1 MAG: hypothetical protein ABT15_07180 [Pseudonocardia sp. SCN 73-27]
MIRRPRRTVPAVLVATVLLAVSVLVTWSSVQVLLGRQPLLPFSDLAAVPAATGLGAPLTVAALAVTAVAGSVLLIAAVVPGAPTVVALAASPEDGAPTSGVTRRSLVRTLTRAADVDGIDAATVRLTGRRVVVTARTPYRTARADLVAHVRDAVTDRLADVGLARPVTVVVRIAQPRRAAGDDVALRTPAVGGGT